MPDPYTIVARHPDGSVTVDIDGREVVIPAATRKRHLCQIHCPFYCGWQTGHDGGMSYCKEQWHLENGGIPTGYRCKPGPKCPLRAEEPAP